VNSIFPHTKPKQLWIGLVEVRPLPGCEVIEETRAAFVHMAAWAASAYEYRRKIGMFLGELRLFVIAIPEAEPVEQKREREGFLEESMEEIIFEATRNPYAVIYGTFHTYDKVDA
jgi:hypothetical protein